MKKILLTTLALTGVVFAGTPHENRASVQNPDNVVHTTPDVQGKIKEAEARLVKLQELFRTHAGSKEVVFKSLNNLDSTNSQGQREEEQAAKAISDDDNGVSAVKCIVDSKWAVTSNPKQLDVSTANWKDATGDLVLPKFVSALQSNKAGGLAHVTYTENVASEAKGTAPTQLTRTAVIASSAWLLGAKNTSGQKFVCYITVE